MRCAMNESADMRLILSRLDDLIRRLDGKVFSPWLDVKGVAQFLNCSTRKVEELICKGLLLSRRLDPTSSRSTRRFHVKDVVGLLVTGRRPIRLSAAEKREMDRLLS